MHCGKTFINTGHTANREYFLPCPSPQLRMSFIVFSTEGRILMSLTEDRWVQIPLETLLIPLFSIMWQNWTQLTHSCDPWVFFFFLQKKDIHSEYSPFLQSFYSVGLDKCSISLLLWSVNVSNLSSADFLFSHQIISPSPCYSQISYFTNDSFPLSLRDCFLNHIVAVVL